MFSRHSKKTRANPLYFPSRETFSAGQTDERGRVAAQVRGNIFVIRRQSLRYPSSRQTVYQPSLSIISPLNLLATQKLQLLAALYPQTYLLPTPPRVKRVQGISFHSRLTSVSQTLQIKPFTRKFDFLPLTLHHGLPPMGYRSQTVCTEIPYMDIMVNICGYFYTLA